MCSRWVFTVASLTKRFAAITRFGVPFATSRRTSVSRGVRTESPALIASAFTLLLATLLLLLPILRWRRAALTALERDIQADYHRLTLLQREIRECLSRVPQPLPRLVLEMRYLQGSPFFRIAMALHYDERQIYRYQAQGPEQVALQLAEKE